MQLNGMTLTRLTRALIERGLVVEGESHRNGARGQPSRPLSIQGDGAYAIGVNFSHRQIQVGLVNLLGGIVELREEELTRASVTEIAEATHRLTLDMVANAPDRRRRMLGVGFSFPGDFVQNSAQLVSHSYFPELSWRDVRRELQESLPFETYLDNDANVAVMGEFLQGVGQKLSSFIYVHIGHGTKLGIIWQREPFRGVTGNAGIIGHFYPWDRPRPTGQDLLETLRGAGHAIADFPDIESLEINATPELRRWIARAGEQLRRGIYDAARILDPEAIVIGGRLGDAINNALLAEINTATYLREEPWMTRPAMFVSSLGSRAGVVGAASLAFHERLLLTRLLGGST